MSSEFNQNDFRNVIGIARKAVPFIKYGVGIWGLITIITIVKSYNNSFKIIFWSTLVFLALMVVLYLLSRISQSRNQKHWQGPAKIILWSVAILFVCTLTLLFTSVFFNYPRDLRDWIEANKTQSETKIAIQTDTPQIQIDSPKKPLLYKNQIKTKTFAITPYVSTLIKELEDNSGYVYHPNSENHISIACDGGIVPVNEYKTLSYFTGGNITVSNKSNGCAVKLSIRIPRTDPTGNPESFIHDYIKRQIQTAIQLNMSTILEEIKKCLKP